MVSNNFIILFTLIIILIIIIRQSQKPHKISNKETFVNYFKRKHEIKTLEGLISKFMELYSVYIKMKNTSSLHSFDAKDVNQNRILELMYYLENDFNDFFNRTKDDLIYMSNIESNYYMLNDKLKPIRQRIESQHARLKSVTDKYEKLEHVRDKIVNINSSTTIYDIKSVIDSMNNERQQLINEYERIKEKIFKELSEYDTEFSKISEKSLNILNELQLFVRSTSDILNGNVIELRQRVNTIENNQPLSIDEVQTFLENIKKLPNTKFNKLFNPLVENLSLIETRFVDFTNSISDLTRKSFELNLNTEVVLREIEESRQDHSSLNEYLNLINDQLNEITRTDLDNSYNMNIIKLAFKNSRSKYNTIGERIQRIHGILSSIQKNNIPIDYFKSIFSEIENARSDYSFLGLHINKLNNDIKNITALYDTDVLRNEIKEALKGESDLLNRINSIHGNLEIAKNKYLEISTLLGSPLTIINTTIIGILDRVRSTDDIVTNVNLKIQDIIDGTEYNTFAEYIIALENSYKLHKGTIESSLLNSNTTLSAQFADFSSRIKDVDTEIIESRGNNFELSTRFIDDENDIQDVKNTINLASGELNSLSKLFNLVDISLSSLREHDNVKNRLDTVDTEITNMTTAYTGHKQKNDELNQRVIEISGLLSTINDELNNSVDNNNNTFEQRITLYGEKLKIIFDDINASYKKILETETIDKPTLFLTLEHINNIINNIRTKINALYSSDNFSDITFFDFNEKLQWISASISNIISLVDEKISETKLSNINDDYTTMTNKKNSLSEQQSEQSSTLNTLSNTSIPVKTAAINEISTKIDKTFDEIGDLKYMNIKPTLLEDNTKKYTVDFDNNWSLKSELREDLPDDLNFSYLSNDGEKKYMSINTTGVDIHGPVKVGDNIYIHDIAKDKLYNVKDGIVDEIQNAKGQYSTLDEYIIQNLEFKGKKAQLNNDGHFKKEVQFKDKNELFKSLSDKLKNIKEDGNFNANMKIPKSDGTMVDLISIYNANFSNEGRLDSENYYNSEVNGYGKINRGFDNLNNDGNFSTATYIGNILSENLFKEKDNFKLNIPTVDTLENLNLTQGSYYDNTTGSTKNISEHLQQINEYGDFNTNIKINGKPLNVINNIGIVDNGINGILFNGKIKTSDENNTNFPVFDKIYKDTTDPDNPVFVLDENVNITYTDTDETTGEVQTEVSLKDELSRIEEKISKNNQLLQTFNILDIPDTHAHNKLTKLKKEFKIDSIIMPGQHQGYKSANNNPKKKKNENLGTRSANWPDGVYDILAQAQSNAGFRKFGLFWLTSPQRSADDNLELNSKHFRPKLNTEHNVKANDNYNQNTNNVLMTQYNSFEDVAAKVEDDYNTNTDYNICCSALPPFPTKM